MENNVKLNVGIVETVGYGDQINKQKSCQAIIDYIDAKFEGYLQVNPMIRSLDLKIFGRPPSYFILSVFDFNVNYIIGGTSDQPEVVYFP